MVAQDQEVLPEGKPASHAQDRAALPPCLRHANGSARWYFPDGSAPGSSAESAPYGQKSPVLAGRVRSDLISLLGGSLRRFPSGGISSLRRRGMICPARSGGSYGHDHRGGTSRSFRSQPRLLRPSSKPELPLQGNCTT